MSSQELNRRLRLLKAIIDPVEDQQLALLVIEQELEQRFG
jgi:hypothetical protein